MKAIILSAGLGTRLKPLTQLLPKPLIPILNRPLIGYTLEWLKESGISEVGINLHHLPQIIRHRLGDGSKWGVKICYAFEPDLLGTGGGIANLAGLMSCKETLLAVNGDILVRMDLDGLLAFHRAKGALVTMVLTKQKAGFGEQNLVYRNRDGRILRIGKPRTAAGCRESEDDECGYVFAGMHLIEPGVIDQISEVKPSCIVSDRYVRLIMESAPVYGYLPDVSEKYFYWRELGNPERYWEVQREILSGSAPITPSLPRASPGVWISPGAQVSPDAKLVPPVLIGRDAVVGDGAGVGPYVVVGEGCRIGSGACLQESLLWEGVQVASGAELHQTIAAADGIGCNF